MDVVKVIQLLKKEYGKTFFLAKSGSKKPFYVLISCMLSHRTKDEVTYPIAKELYKKVNTPKKMIKLTSKQIEKLIYPISFYKTKAKRLREASKKLIKDYKGKVPNTMEELLTIKGVGRKTAGIVLTHAFNIPALPIDTHCHRLPNRLGWIKTKSPEETELQLMKLIPKRYWLDINELFVKHGQTICKPVSPFCSKCIIRKYCKRVNVKTSR